MARSKYILTFSNMIIPVKIKKLSKEVSVNFKEMHLKDNCGFRLGRKTYCTHCTEQREKEIEDFLAKVKVPAKDKPVLEKLLRGSFMEIPSEEKGKGWVNYDKQEQPLQFTKDELEQLHPATVAEGTIAVQKIIEPLPFKWFKGNHHIITPEKPNTAIQTQLALFLHGLEQTSKVALVKYWDSNTEYNAVINGNGIMSGIFYADEVGDEVEELAEVNKITLDAKLEKLIVTLVSKSVQDFEPSDVVNTYREEVTKRAIEKQEKGEFTPMVAPVATTATATTDLMASLLKGIEDAEKTIAPKKKKVA